MRREILLPEAGLTEDLVIHRKGRATQGSGLQEKPADPSSFDWMPRLEDVDPRLGPIAPAALNNAAPPATVASRLVARSGTVSTEQISLDKTSRPRKWIFPRPSNAGDSNFLGLGVGIRQRVTASTLAVTIRSFDRPSESFQLELGSQNRLQIQISNLEPSRIFGRQTRVTHLETDNDFRYLYRLSADQSAVTPNLKIPRLDSGGINDGSETCGGSVGKGGGGSP
jgi:hypothetical protein